MGWTDDEIEHFFKKAANQQPVEYQDAYWKEMEALLDAKKPAKKRLGWWFFGGASVLFILGLGAYFIVHYNGINRKSMVANLQSTHSKEQQLTDKSQVNRVNRNSEEDEWQIVEEQTAYLPLSTGEKHSVAIDKSKQRERNVTPEIKQYEASTTAQLMNQDTHTAKNQESTIDQQRLQKIGQPADAETLVANTFVSESTEEPEISPLESTQIESIQPDNAAGDKGENTNPAAIGDEDLIMKRKSGFYAGVDAGAGTSYLRTSKNLIVQWGVKIGYDYTFAETFRVGAGVGYRQQIANDLEIRQQRAYYAMDIINVNQNIKYDRLQFVDLNVHAHYLFRKFSIGIEVTPSYLIGARAKMDQKQEKNGEVVEGTMTYSTDRKYVRSNSFHAFGLDAGLSFQYEFRRKMVIELGVNSRLNPLLKNPGFVGETNKVPLKIELGIIKRF